MTVFDRTSDKSGTPRFIAADRLKDGLMIEFEGGHYALFSYAFLHAKVMESELREDHNVEIESSAT